MRVPYQWLREYAPDAPTDIAELEQLLSISGTKVEAIHEFGVPSSDNGNTAGFKVGRVVSFEKHPNADKLRLCRVDVGEADTRQIVCGASNFSEGDTVAVVLPGSTMPGGFQIKPAKLRGEESLGMMLSERELELSQEHDGIMILPTELTPGAPLGDHVPLGDTVIEPEITPNRPDCLSIFGVARELAAVTGTQLVDALSGDAEAMGTGDVTDYVTVTNEAPDLCPRYMARALTGVTVGVSPYWLRSRLAAAGMRAINNVVDVTNYVM
ncbi:MAG: phenylalanine--tRNA ligase subunit beta, partial [Thermoleophilia bacterium]|nr:phenylalanine--tRNA ligase subunit beta [Thermoleophilia bacterium]